MVYILIPIFNEEKNILNLYNELSDVIKGWEDVYFVFSDDGSKDNSIKLLNEIFKDYKFTILGDGINRGPGFAFNRGFEWILKDSKSNNDIVVTMEADCTSDVKLLPKMVSIQRLGFDLVLASVYAQGGGFDKTSFLRRFLSSVANLLFRFLFDIKVLTLSSFYRVYSLELLRKIKEKNNSIINENGFICMLEVLVKSIELDAKIIEVPMKLYSQKRKGKSKMKIIKTGLEYLKFLIKRKL
jgi:dolichol-phosphate mannosyltransferase